MTQDSKANRTRQLHTLALVAAALALLALWHFGAVPTSNRLARGLHSAAHFPVFGALTAIVFVLLRKHAAGALARGTGTYAAAFMTMTVLSLAAEGLQTQLDARHGSMRDVGVNLLGAATVLAILALREPWASRRTRRVLWTTAIACIMTVVLPVATLGAAYAKRTLDFPTLARFNLPLDQLHVTAVDAQLSRTVLPPTLRKPDDSAVLCVKLGGTRYPGITFSDPVADWRGFHTLELDLANPDPAELRLTLRIDDDAFDGSRKDRFSQRIELPGNSRVLVNIPLAEMREALEGRQMQIERIARILLYARGVERGRRFCLAYMRLLASPDQSPH